MASMVITAIRLSVVLLFVVAAIPGLFVLPFLFDDPKATGSPFFVVSLVAIGLSIPLSFFVSQRIYKSALARNEIAKSFVAAISPLLWVAFLAMIWVGFDRV
ncbi:MAG: hypothetical protein HYX43_18645 [Burkholderiales bacterium]|nr:hypothetical protein [Burkholderiales bacterium]